MTITVASLHRSTWVGVALVKPGRLRRRYREAAARRVGSLTPGTIHAIGVAPGSHGTVPHGTRSAKRDLSTGLVGRRGLAAARVRGVVVVVGLDLGL